MRSTRRRFGLVGVILALVAGSVVATSPAQASTFTTAQVTMMNQGASWTFSQAAGDIFTLYGGAGARGAHWSRSDGSDSWYLSVQANNNGTLVPGVYDNAENGFYREWRQPAISLSHNSSACGNDSGRFVVNQVELNPDSSFKKLDLYFEHWCHGFPGQATYGRIVLDLPAPAISSPPAPSALFAASSAGDKAIPRVFAQADGGVSSITAHFISPATGTEAGSTSAFTRQSGTSNLGVWVASAPVVLGDPGFYRIDTEIVDQGGVHVTQSGVGYLAYFAVSSFQNVALDPNFVDVDHRTTWATGKLTKRLPGTNEVQPIASGAVAIRTVAYICACVDARDSVVIGSGVTAADGTFRIEISPTRTDSLFAEYLGTPAGTVGSESTQVAVFLNAAPVKIFAPDVFWGPTATVAGRILYQSGGTWKPMANTTVELRNYNASGYWNYPTTTTTTDAQGQFSVSHTGIGAGSSVGIVAEPSDPFLGRAMKQIPYGSYQPGMTFAAFLGYWDSNQYGRYVQFLGLADFPGSGAGQLIFLQKESALGWETVGSSTLVQTSDGWLFQMSIVPDCGITRFRAAYGVGNPGGEVYSGVLYANMYCEHRKAGGAATRPIPPRRAFG